ncbi:MAG: hypothetical protein AVDCRST_MAG33-688 [uncultured Thermomicrobiales bacterium]|uniref:DUF4365 domain-containing protein n=1 Tax=uncultured Thermomicrobiales bacterium TaxID=1645740 RepID=A0A6J4UEL8_9BACT|nr:MAG: hypothetical protein AVDCRST_MAG33-688 [uncultured Thermomicrobiales bacterium]
MVDSDHTTHSTYREMVLEHLFVGEVMRYCWQNQLPRIELLKSQVDSSGYDRVLEANSTIRHLQLKASHVGAATPGVNLNIELGKKPSGCVVWMFFDRESLAFSHFLWFGNRPGEPLADLAGYRTSTHNKRNAQGIKTERAGIRYLPKREFDRIESIEDIVGKLFGEQPRRSVADDDDTDDV